jgi:hypothetical protein
MSFHPSGLRKKPLRDSIEIRGQRIQRSIGEFWTSKQRQGSSIHEVSYRACFKAELPRFFIEQLSAKNEIVYDPFSGRGTTVIEAGLLGRRVIANDVNPISEILCRPRFFVPDLDKLAERLRSIKYRPDNSSDIDLSMFYHKDTTSEIVSLRSYLSRRKAAGEEDHLDRWIRMIATNRLSGHSSGFFSVYSLPPNQAVSQESQRKINRRLRQKPAYRDTKAIILRKSQSLMRNLTPAEIAGLKACGKTAKFYNNDSGMTSKIRSNSVQLVVTSPPFLNVVQYASDNWLRCWFNKIDAAKVAGRITIPSDPVEWSQVMRKVFDELHRIVKPGGWVAFEVGEVRNRTINLDELVIPLATSAGLRCEGLLINSQSFTKTSNIWGVHNNRSGTNTNRIALFSKE